MQQFTKRDLKTGMVVTMTSGRIGRVCLGHTHGDIIILDGSGGRLSYLHLDKWSDELEYYSNICSEDFTINKVDEPKTKLKIFIPNVAQEVKSRWTQGSSKNMTIAEIEAELGYSIKVVK